MDWNLALQHNQQILLRNVAWLFTWLKLEVGDSVERMPRHKWLAVLFVLRPSESAYRRVIYIAMFVRGIVAPAYRMRKAKSARPTVKSSDPTKPSDEERTRRVPPAFRLIDPRKQFDLNPNKPKIAKGPGPFITDFWSDDPIYDRSVLYAYQEKMNRPRPEDMNAVSLCRRMNALMAALQDLDGQALRMVKLHMRMQYRTAQTGKYQKRPMRPGLPPGYRQRQKHEVDEVLAECHRLALMAQQEFKFPDTS